MPKFEQRDALLVIDVIAEFDHEDAGALLASFRERGAALANAIASAREAGTTILADACATVDAELEQLALRYAHEVGGIHVRRLAAL